MQTTNTTQTERAQEIQRIRRTLNTTSDARVLNALGHPGYSDKYAGQILNAWAYATGLDGEPITLHQAAGYGA
jgi:hypothetical protein